MKPHAFPFLMAALIIASPVAAQTFSGSDDFSTTTSNWTAIPGDAGGQMSVNYGTLNFTDSGLAINVTSNAVYAWIANSGSYLSDWQAQVDFNLNLSLRPGEIALWEMIVTNSADTTDYFVAALKKIYTGVPPSAQAYAYTDSAMVSPYVVSQSSTDLVTSTLRITYSAASTTLTASFDGNGATDGYSFTDIHSVNLSTGVTNWSMLPTDYFTLRLQAWHTAGSTEATTMMVESTFTADNFLATSGTPVPEPATYTLLAGLAALGLVVWRRRA